MHFKYSEVRIDNETISLIMMEPEIDEEEFEFEFEVMLYRNYFNKKRQSLGSLTYKTKDLLNEEMLKKYLLREEDWQEMPFQCFSTEFNYYLSYLGAPELFVDGYENISLKVSTTNGNRQEVELALDKKSMSLLAKQLLLLTTFDDEFPDLHFHIDDNESRSLVTFRVI